MKELVNMMDALCQKYGISAEDIQPIAQKIGELVGPERAAELADMEAAGEDSEPVDEGGEFDDLEEDDA